MEPKGGKFVEISKKIDPGPWFSVFLEIFGPKPLIFHHSRCIRLCSRTARKPSPERGPPFRRHFPPKASLVTVEEVRNPKKIFEKNEIFET